MKANPTTAYQAVEAYQTLAKRYGARYGLPNQVPADPAAVSGMLNKLPPEASSLARTVASYVEKRGFKSFMEAVQTHGKPLGLTLAHTPGAYGSGAQPLRTKGPTASADFRRIADEQRAELSAVKSDVSRAMAENEIFIKKLKVELDDFTEDLAHALVSEPAAIDLAKGHIPFETAAAVKALSDRERKGAETVLSKLPLMTKLVALTEVDFGKGSYQRGKLDLANKRRDKADAAELVAAAGLSSFEQVVYAVKTVQTARKAADALVAKLESGALADLGEKLSKTPPESLTAVKDLAAKVAGRRAQIHFLNELQTKQLRPAFEKVSQELADLTTQSATLAANRQVIKKAPAEVRNDLRARHAPIRKNVDQSLELRQRIIGATVRSSQLYQHSSSSSSANFWQNYALFWMLFHGQAGGPGVYGTHPEQYFEQPQTGIEGGEGGVGKMFECVPETSVPAWQEPLPAVNEGTWCFRDPATSATTPGTDAAGTAHGSDNQTSGLGNAGDGSASSSSSDGRGYDDYNASSSDAAAAAVVYGSQSSGNSSSDSSTQSYSGGY